MTCWSVVARNGGATVYFGVEASSERTATVAAMQRLTLFPDPWPTAEFGLEPYPDPADRLTAREDESS